MSKATISPDSFDQAARHGWSLQLAAPFSYRTYREEWIPRLASCVERTTAGGGRARAFDVDVSARASIDRLVTAVEDGVGPIDALVNSAGITRRHPAVAFPETDWQRILDVNLSGVFYTCQAAGRRMVERTRGRIVNMVSIAGEIGLPMVTGHVLAVDGGGLAS